MTGKERIAEQSRQWLWESFLDLLKQTDYAQITISKIAQHAELDRRTFYRSFRDKQDLIDWYIKNTIIAYHEILSKENPADLKIEDGIKLIFDFWWQQRQSLSILIQNDLASRFLTFWEPDANECYQTFNTPWHINGSQKEITYIMTYSTGGFWNVIQHWLGSEDPDEPEQMATVMVKTLRQLSKSFGESSV